MPGRTFSSSSSSSCCSSDLTSSVSGPFCSLSPFGTFSPFSYLWLPHWVSWNCLESAVLGMEQLQPVLTETPSLTPAPSTNSKEIFKSNLTTGPILQDLAPMVFLHLQRGVEEPGQSAFQLAPGACLSGSKFREHPKVLCLGSLQCRLRVPNPGSFAGSEYPVLVSLAQGKLRHSSGVGLSWSEQLQAQAGHGQGMSMDTVIDMGMACLSTPSSVLPLASAQALRACQYLVWELSNPQSILASVTWCLLAGLDATSSTVSI